MVIFLRLILFKLLILSEVAYVENIASKKKGNDNSVTRMKMLWTILHIAHV